MKMDYSNSSFSNEIIKNSSEYILPTKVPIAGVYVFGIIALLGVCGNGFVILIFTKSNVLHGSLQKTSLKAILHLALTDLLTMASIGSATIQTLLDVKMSYNVCLISLSIPVYMTFVTQCVLGITTFDRFVAICKQQKYSKIMTKRTLNVLLGFAWILPLFFSLLSFFRFNNSNEVFTCNVRYLYHKWIILAQSVFFVMVMVLTVSLYIPIVFKAMEFHRKTYPAQSYGVNARTARLKEKRQAIRNSIFIGVMTFVFMICNLPFYVVRFHIGTGYVITDTVFQVTMILGVINSVVNPFLYAFQNQVFRKEALKCLKCKCLTKLNTDKSLPSKRYQEQGPTPPKVTYRE